ncbi:unnamed protein product [Phytophthora fragariaefolia]|uniref:Unnamed protein product n=1 Tax=Phytophthora fragariaefolia TaxID=1490495 RepID=A0A9W6Y7N8_9STRA|nr:unnamed protein product [Phytophthora fragariaefolia]
MDEPSVRNMTSRGRPRRNISFGGPGVSHTAGVSYTQENDQSLTVRSPSSEKGEARPAWPRYTLPHPNWKHRPRGKSTGNVSYQPIDESALERARAAHRAHQHLPYRIQTPTPRKPHGLPQPRRRMPPRPRRMNGATLAKSGSHAKKSAPTKTQAPATTTAPSAKSTRRTRASKRTEVRLPCPYVEPAPSESDTDTPNPDLITGDEDSTAGSPAPRATKPSEGEPATANTTASEPTPVDEAAIPSSDVSSDARKAEDFVNSSDSQDPKMVANGQWQSRFFDRHIPTPPVILEEVIQKIQKSCQSQPIEPRSVLGRVSAYPLRGPAQQRPRDRRSSPRGDSLAPMSYRYQVSRATSPDTGSSRYARGASVSTRHGSRGYPQYQEAEVELGGEAGRDAPRLWPGSRGDELPASSSESRGGLLSAVESCQRLLDAQRADLVTLRGRLQTVESLSEAGPEDLRRLRHPVQGFPEQVDHLGRELDRVSCRLSQCEGIVGEARHSLSEHLGWILTLYSRVSILEDRDTRRQADLVARSAPAPAPGKKELLEVMANALRQYSAGQNPRGRSPQPDGTA